MQEGKYHIQYFGNSRASPYNHGIEKEHTCRVLQFGQLILSLNQGTGPRNPTRSQGEEYRMGRVCSVESRTKKNEKKLSLVYRFLRHVWQVLAMELWSHCFDNGKQQVLVLAVGSQPSQH
jgi:hypothetical protein